MLRIQKQQGLTKKQEILLRVGTIVLALVASGVMMAALGYNPFTVYLKMIKGALLKIQHHRHRLEVHSPSYNVARRVGRVQDEVLEHRR